MRSLCCRFQGEENIHADTGRGRGFLFFGLKALGGGLHLVFLLNGRDGEGEFAAGVRYRFSGFDLFAISADVEQFDLRSGDSKARIPEHGSGDDGREFLFLFFVRGDQAGGQ